MTVSSNHATLISISRFRRSIRHLIVSAALVVGLLAVGVSSAHVGPTTTTLTATRDADGNVTTTAGEWTATVLAVTGKVGQAWLYIRVDTDLDGETDTLNIIGVHPKRGSTLRSNQVIPADPQSLR